MSCYSIRPTTTSALPRLLPDPLLDRIDAIQRADPWAHEDAVDESGIDGYADSPPLGAAAARLGFAPPFDDAATPPWPPHAASLERLEQSGLQPSPRVLPGADQVRTPYTQTFRIGPRTILGADTPITIVNRFCLDHGLALWELGGISAEQQRWELYRLLRKVQWPETADEYAEAERLGTRGALGSLLRDEALRRSRAGRTVVGTTAKALGYCEVVTLTRMGLDEALLQVTPRWDPTHPHPAGTPTL